MGLGLGVSYFALVAFPPIGLVGLAFAYGYVYFLFFTVIQKTSLGEDEPPTTPELDHVVDVLPVLWKVIVLFVVWTAPAVIVSHLVAGKPRTLVSLEAVGQLLGGPGTLWAYMIGPGQVDVVRVVAALGVLLLPMSLLAVATFNSLRGLHPVPLAATIVRVPLQYLVCCVVFYLVVFLRAVLTIAVAVTSASFVLAVCLQPLFLVYSLYVLGRMLGGLHAANSARLGWVQA